MYLHKTDVHNLRAPSLVVPILFEKFKPSSVLDVGCGIGTWLSVCKNLGISDYFGIDGDYVNSDLLKENINLDHFGSVDLTAAFDLNRQFDLVLCLEVAEHLKESSAGILIDSLCRHSEIIVFSAAIPFQGGQNHLNEQWPEYWIKLFKNNAYKCYDIIRPQIWDMDGVDWWYKQNIFVFSKKSLDDYAESENFQSLVHPLHFNQKVTYIRDLNLKVYELTMELQRWENGKSGLRRSTNNFLKSLLFKFGIKK